MNSKNGLEDQLESDSIDNFEASQDQKYTPKITNRAADVYRSKAKLLAVAARLKEDELYFRRCRDNNRKNLILSRYNE